MKLTFLILSILFTVQCFGQKWHLNKVDKNEDYPYEYWFQFENKEDTSSYQLTTKLNRENSTIRLIDNQGDTVIFANIKVINLAIESETNLTSDFNGNTQLRLENGKYRIEVKASNYAPFNLEFEIGNGQQIDLNIILGLAPELEVYQIDSKTELEETEILEIIKCVRINRDDFHKICSNLKKYRIMMHI
ncbi:Carboxypeptidase regulatory-like domain-containing protein [Lishizhenia tianjinensis]|uniref:Carboxypeptidase regulatory-like domain-containing protein n=1 Tax=Lishizhenia tianjinensis TaxID=477690 RepID=A0A1I6XZ73_9FLAO|nr:carboxypeptidase-like regulatory domain-containing protein [Lishizhenia tianjinensis]SFT43403.1 Carboxypeptidase regulatory-like domain-containing protein [Lishizhenia tianjinensis]